MPLYVIRPIFLFFTELLGGKPYLVNKKCRYTGVEILDKIAFQSVIFHKMRKSFRKVLHKAGVMDGCGTVHYGVIVIEHKAFVTKLHRHYSKFINATRGVESEQSLF